MEEKSRNRFVIIIALILVAAVFYSFAINLFGETPSVELADINEDAQNSATVPVEPGDIVPVDVTPETVQSVIAELDRYTSYQRSVVVEYFQGNETLGSLIALVAVDGGWTRADVTGQNGLVEHSIVGDGTRWLWYDSETDYLRTPASESSADLAQRLPTYEDVLDVDPEAITAASYESRGELPCIYVEVEQAELGYQERYWISVESGLLVSAETIKDGQVVYRMSSYQVTSPLVDSEGSFTLPDGTVLHQAGD